MIRVSTVCHDLKDVAPPQMLQLSWCRPCSLPRAYRPRHHVLLCQSLSRRSFFLFFFFFCERQQLWVSICLSWWCQNNALSTATTTSTSTSATLALRGYHLHVVHVGFCSSHNIRVITTLQLWGNVSSLDSTFNLFSSLTVCGAPTVTVGRY
jgi:hypothetical protein